MKKSKKQKLRFKYYLFLKMGFICFFISLFLSSITQINFWQNDNDKILKIEEYEVSVNAKMNVINKKIIFE